MAVHGQTLRVGRLGVEITHPAKVLFPADGIEEPSFFQKAVPPYG
jgi:DNA primase